MDKKCAGSNLTDTKMLCSVLLLGRKPVSKPPPCFELWEVESFGRARMIWWSTEVPASDRTAKDTSHHRISESVAGSAFCIVL